VGVELAWTSTELIDDGDVRLTTFVMGIRTGAALGEAGLLLQGRHGRWHVGNGLASRLD
jgi:hypothetical protein